MGTEIKTWQIVEGKLQSITTNLKNEGRTEPYDLEPWLESNAGILGSDNFNVMRDVRLTEKTDSDEELMSKLEQVNSMDIADAVRLGCRTMQNVFNADDNHVPFFGSTLRPKAALSFSAHLLKHNYERREKCESSIFFSRLSRVS